MGITLRKITEANDLSKCSATSRILVNGKIAGIIFPLSPRIPVFVREENGVVYELSTDIDEIRYLPNGSIETISSWKRSGRYVAGYGKEVLKHMGVID